jgi:hypothetical protein
MYTGKNPPMTPIKKKNINFDEAFRTTFRIGSVLWKQSETLFSFFSLTSQHASIKVICPCAESTDII